MKIGGLKANFIFNVAGPILSLIIILITTPIYISYIGLARYGLLAIIWSLLGYFGFIDLGLNRASSNALAKIRDPARHRERATVLATTLSLNLILGLIGGLIFYFTGIFFIEHLVTIPPELKPEIISSLPWVSYIFPLALMSGTGAGSLESREMFLIVNILAVVGSATGLILPLLCAIFISPNLSTVLPATVIARAFSVLVMLCFAFRDEPPIRPQNFSWKRAKSLLSYGGWASISTVIGPILASACQLIIGAVLGVTAVAYFSIPWGFVVRSQLLPAALSRTLFPRLSRTSSEEARILAQTALITVSYAYSAICATAILLTRTLLDLWMGKDFSATSTPVAELLLLGGWINGFMFMFEALLFGQGRPDLMAKIHAAEVVPYILILGFLTSHFGLLGAASSWNLMVTSEAIVLFIVSRCDTGIIWVLAPPLGFLVGAYVYVSLMSPVFFNAIITSGLMTAGIGICALIFDTKTREFVASLRLPKHEQQTLRGGQRQG